MTIESGYYFATYSSPNEKGGIVEIIYITQSGYACRHSEDRTYALDAFTIGDKIELPNRIPNAHEMSKDNRDNTFLIVQATDYPGGDIAERLTEEFHTERIAGTPELTSIGVAETIERENKIRPITHIYVFTQEDETMSRLQRMGFTVTREKSSEGKKYVEGYHVFYRNIKENPIKITRPGIDERTALAKEEKQTPSLRDNPRV